MSDGEYWGNGVCEDKERSIVYGDEVGVGCVRIKRGVECVGMR